MNSGKQRARRWLVVVGLVLVALLAVAIALNVAAARDRARSRAALLEGRRLFAAGRLDEAKAVLKEAFLADRDNRELAAVLHEVNLAITDRDATKAHVQHGHEGPGGTLRPQDVVR